MNPGADRILLTGVRAVGHHGVYPAERRDGQEFVVDLELTLPLDVAAATDDVAATVHYGELAVAVAEAIGGEPVALIETLAERVASLALADPRVSAVAVTVHKPAAPIAVPFGDVAVRIERTRAPAPPEHVVIALGSNLGDRAALLEEAVSALRRLSGLTVDAVSSPHETVAVTADGPDASRPSYLNRVLVGSTTLPPAALLDALLGIERVLGRTRGERWGDRTVDLDLIALGRAALDTPALVLPHPRAHERSFVLQPWAEVEPDAVLPGHGPIRDLLAGLS